MGKIIAGSDLKKHVSFLVCPEVEEICKSLFTHPTVKTFEFSNHEDHMRNAFITRAKMSRVYTPALIPENQSYLLISNWIENMRHPAQRCLQSQLYSQHELFGLGNELTIIKRH